MLIEWNDIVFLCRNGTPVKNSTYDTGLFKYCDRVGIPHFSMHREIDLVADALKVV